MVEIFSAEMKMVPTYKRLKNFGMDFYINIVVLKFVWFERKYIQYPPSSINSNLYRIIVLVK